MPPKLRYVREAECESRRSHRDSDPSQFNCSRDGAFEPCVFAIKNNLTHPVSIFADADSIVCYKTSSDVNGATSEFTEDASSTSGSYILADDVIAGVAVSSC